MRPLENEYAPFYAGYIGLVQETDIVKTFQESVKVLREDLASITSENADHAYATGKWTLKQVLQHLIDTERIFAYRALSIARGETQSLPGFDENAYADQTMLSTKEIEELKEELILLRQTSYYLVKGFSQVELSREGKVNNGNVTVRAITYMMIGHIRHHFNVIRERYLIK